MANNQKFVPAGFGRRQFLLGCGVLASNPVLASFAQAESAHPIDQVTLLVSPEFAELEQAHVLQEAGVSEVHILDADPVLLWRDVLESKYSRKDHQFIGLTSWHDYAMLSGMLIESARFNPSTKVAGRTGITDISTYKLPATNILLATWKTA